MTALLPTPVSLRDWLTSVSSLLDDRRVQPGELAHDLVLLSGSWNPVDGASLLAGRVAETARTDLRLACTMIHHAAGSALLGYAGRTHASASTDDSLLVGLTDVAHVSGGTTDAAATVRVTGSVGLCCEPGRDDTTLVLVEDVRERVLVVPIAERAAGVAVTRRPGGTLRLDLDDAGATALAPLRPPRLEQVRLITGVLEAAAWYGALTRLADRLLEQARVEAGDTDAAAGGAGARRADAGGRLAEVETILSSTWGAVRDAVAVWERGESSLLTARHHAARARMMARLAATSVMFGYVPHEDEAAGSGRLPPALREHLVGWLGRSDASADEAAVTTSLLRDGPSW
jgi:hypothetical protein